MNKILPLISIIIVNYNAGILLLDCVKSILESKYKNVDIIIVDNNSADDSHEKCKEKFPQINLIENSNNVGYCEGNNIGIRNAKGDCVVILNPDTVVDPNWLEELLSAYLQFGEGIYQPKILSMNNKKIIATTGNMIHLFGFGFARDRGEVDKNQRNKIEQIGYASGTCLFTSYKILQKIGFFDSFLFLYHDDLDLGWRAAQLGIKSYYVPNSVIYHAESYLLKWNAKKFFWLERNRQYCLKTHYSKKTYSKILLSLVIVNFLVWIFYLSKGFIGSKIKADLDIIKNRKHISQRYVELENKKEVPDVELIKFYPDSIFVPSNVFGIKINKLFNKILSSLSKRAKQILSG